MLFYKMEFYISYFKLCVVNFLEVGQGLATKKFILMLQSSEH